MGRAMESFTTSTHSPCLLTTGIKDQSTDQYSCDHYIDIFVCTLLLRNFSLVPSQPPHMLPFPHPLIPTPTPTHAHTFHTLTSSRTPHTHPHPTCPQLIAQGAASSGLNELIVAIGRSQDPYNLSEKLIPHLEVLLKIDINIDKSESPAVL